MSTRLELVQATYNRALKNYRFTLDNGSVPLVLHHAPDGFIDKEAGILARHARYKTVLRNTSKNELMFPKEGRDYLQTEYDNDGVDAKVTLLVEKLNKITYTYEEYPFPSKFDFATYDINEIGVSIQMMDSNFLEKVFNRSTSPIDVLKRVSINGTTMAAIADGIITIPEVIIDLESIWNIYEATGTNNDIVPITISTTDMFEESSTPDRTATIGDIETSFFKNIGNSYALTITGTITGHYQTSGSGGGATFRVIKYAFDGTPIQAYDLFTIYTAHHDLDFDEDYSISVSIEDNQYLTLEAILTDSDGFVDYHSGYHKVETSISGNPEVTAKGFLYYEFFLSLLQLITGEANPFKSDYLGRTDSALTTYAADGEGSLGFILRGIYLRLETNVTNTISSNLDEAFSSLNSVHNLGLGYEKIGGVDKIVIEDYDSFLKSNVILDLSDRLREEDIGKKVLPKEHFKTGEFGFGKFEYEKTAGLFEFNTKGIWTTEIQSVDNDLKQISKIRGDGQGMRKILNAPYHLDDNGVSDYDKTADVSGDDDLFMLNAVRDGLGFTARTDEGFSHIGGSVYASSSFNVLYSPARTRNRFGDFLKAGLIKNLGSVVRWQATDKNSTLESQLTTEGSIVYENADINAADLKSPRFLPEEYYFECPISTIELKAVMDNPNGLIKLGTGKYGWINYFKPNTSDQMCSFNLLRCNLDVVSPV